MALAGIGIGQQGDARLLDHPADGVRQLDLPALPRRLRPEEVEDPRIQQVASRNRQIARRLLDGRLLDEIDDPPALDLQDPVTRDLLRRDTLAADDGCGGTTDLTEEQVDKYTAMFADPEEISDEEVQADCWIAITGYDD